MAKASRTRFVASCAASRPDREVEPSSVWDASAMIRIAGSSSGLGNTLSSHRDVWNTCDRASGPATARWNCSITDRFNPDVIRRIASSSPARTTGL